MSCRRVLTLVQDVIVVPHARTHAPTPCALRFCRIFGASTMANGGSSKWQWPVQRPSKLTICITVFRLALILDLIPEEISRFLRLPAVRSTVIRTRETRRFLQVAASFRHLFPTTSQAYIASKSPPPILVWTAYIISEKWWAPLPEYGRRVLWGLGLLLVDYMIARLLERIATCTLEAVNEETEEELQLKMPATIQPPRAHVFEITTSSAKHIDDEDTAPLLKTEDIPVLAANLYYASPITMLASGLYDSFQNVWCLLLLWSIYEMMFAQSKKSRVSLAAMSLALATYGQPWSMAFAVPICKSQPSIKTATVFISLFITSVLWLQVLSFMLVGTEAFWTWKPVTALTPNLGPRWYFQMQLFDRFHDYFAIMFAGMPYLVVIPLTIRLHRFSIVLVRRCP